MNYRVETLRDYLDNLVSNTPKNDCWFVDRHMHAVSQFSAMLAEKRSLNIELALMIGLLHDLSTLLTGNPSKHAHHGAKKAKEILEYLEIATPEEIAIITTAIYNHSAKEQVHDEYCELIKDADVLSHYYFNPNLGLPSKERDRLENLKVELSI